MRVGRRQAQWELAARLFDNQPELEPVIETVYYGDRSSYPEAIAAIIWESQVCGWRDEEEVAALREELTRKAALHAMGSDLDVEAVSVMIDEHLRDREREEEAHEEYHRRAEANDELAQ